MSESISDPTAVTARPPMSAGRIVCAVCAGVAAVPLALLVMMVLNSRFGDGSTDPHGYGMIVGTFLSAPLALVVAALVPFAFPPGRRLLAAAVSLLGFVVLVGGLFLLLG